MEDIQFTVLNDQQKTVLLKALDFDVDENGVILAKTGKPHICPYTKKKVLLSNASIMPGSVIVMNTSSLTLSEYISDYVDL